MSYQSQLRNHLGEYKISNLCIEKDGFWRNKPYSHILPKEEYRLNILGTIREKFWDYFESQESLKMHRYFHHLNSSQAMCFNLFFPFMMDGNKYLNILLDVLGLPEKGVSEVSFGKIIDKSEGTNFDFYIAYENGIQILFEVKLQESGFGSTRNDAEHNKKFQQIYKNRMKNIISTRFQNRLVFFKNYQLIRNLIYLGYSDKTHLFFMMPFENKPLENKTAEIIHYLVDGKFEDRINIGFLENLVSLLVGRFEADKIDLLKKHFDWFTSKYIIFNKPSLNRKEQYTYPLYNRYKDIIWK